MMIPGTSFFLIVCLVYLCLAYRDFYSWEKHKPFWSFRRLRFFYSIIYSVGTSRWGEFGEGGLLWGECNGKSFEWFDGNPVEELLCKVCNMLCSYPSCRLVIVIWFYLFLSFYNFFITIFFMPCYMFDKFCLPPRLI